MRQSKANKEPTGSKKVNVKSPSKTKTPDRKSSGRKPKIYKLPVYKVKKIMKLALTTTRNSDVEAIAQDALHLAIKATEGFLVTLMKQAYARANEPKELTYDHVAEFIHSEPSLAFPNLREAVPKIVKAENYVKNMKTQEKDHTPLTGWIEWHRFKYSENPEQSIKRLTSDKYSGGYFRMVFNGDKSYLEDKNFLKSRMKRRKLQERIRKD